MPAKLTICYPDRPATERFLAEEQHYELGRSADCDVRLLHPSVSRKHAKVSSSSEAWLLSDIQSRNGTKVNGIKITSSTLTDDAIISVGRLDCLFETKTPAQYDAYQQHQTWRQSQAQNIQVQPQASSNITSDLTSQIYRQLQNILSLVGTQRGMVVVGNSLDVMSLIANVGFQQADFRLQQFEGSIGAIENAITNQHSVIAMDVSHHRLLQGRESIQLKQIAALACIPLLQNNTVIGAIYTDSKLSDKVLTELDVEILQHIAKQIESGVHALLLQQTIDVLQKSIEPGSQYINLTDSQLLALCH